MPAVANNKNVLKNAYRTDRSDDIAPRSLFVRFCKPAVEPKTAIRIQLGEGVIRNLRAGDYVRIFVSLRFHIPVQKTLPSAYAHKITVLEIL